MRHIMAVVMYICRYIHQRIYTYILCALLCELYVELTPWSRVLFEKLTGFQLAKKFPAFHGTRRFITAFTSALHPSLSWAGWFQYLPPHTTSWKSILILSSHLRLGLTSGPFPSGFPTKTLYTPLLSPIRATCPVHLIVLYFYHPKNNGWEVQIIELLTICIVFSTPLSSCPS